MRKHFWKLNSISKFIEENILFFLTLFLIIFIPLYPKIPLLDIQNTWVYVRAEDFVVFGALLIWFLFLLTKKVTLKTPLTIPIFAYWIIGGVGTLHGILLIFPNIANVFPNVSYLSYLRHIEYLSLFFLAYAGIRNKKFLKYAFFVLVITVIGVILYGFGQKYFSFPAYLTMNEEFAKGIPIQLSNLSRVPSTFAGHYDLAAYLVLVIPIIASVFFALRNFFAKLALALVVFGSFVLMVMTVSRVSFVALIISLFIVFFLQRKKLVFFLLPVIFILVGVFIYFNSNLLARYTNTISKVDVLVNAKTGEAVGNIEYVPVEYFKNKRIKLQRVEENKELISAIGGKFEEEKIDSTKSAVLPIDLLPTGAMVPLVKASNISTGETLPQGTGYINLSLSPVERRVGDFYYELSPDVVEKKGDSYDIVNFHGNFIIKKASAYDLSFTTRFQGEWPNAITAFTRNVFLGSGYGSISLAIDNNYLRILGETGVLGLASFFGIFIIIGIYIKKTWFDIESKFTKSFIIGYIAGVIGLFLNATLIDVFEASKIAFVLWLLTGIVLGTLHFYEKSPLNIYIAFKKVALSIPGFVFYILLTTILVFLPITNNFFTGDDFTWFRWAIDCGNLCENTFRRLMDYFISSDGFFFRPGTKTYFVFMYNIFWMNQTAYHLVSIALHFIVSVLLFLLGIKILKNKILAGLITVLFLLLSGYAEAVFWISATGHLFNSLFMLLSLYFYVIWREKKDPIYFLISLFSGAASLLFHELGVVVPLFIISYSVIFENIKLKKIIKNIFILLYFFPICIYLLVRFISRSHWLSGDYNYDLLMFPFNAIGNVIGYALITFLGLSGFPFYNILRQIFRENILLSIFAALAFILVVYYILRYLIKLFTVSERKIIAFGFVFFIISLIPFLGLGNITSRYSYLATFGLLLIIAISIRKIYEVLLVYGRDIAVSGMIVLFFIFSALHIIQVQKLHGDWKGAGDMVERFFISIDSEYEGTWSEEEIELHFVNVPIRFGDAWVFPVGLEDALYISFKNNNLKIFKHPSIDDARKAVSLSSANKIFEFQPDGSIIEIPIREDGYSIMFN